MAAGQQDSAAKMADYEKVSKQGDTKVASFDEDENTPLRRLQHFLHSNPTAIPVIVLVLGIILFTVIAGGKFLHPFNLSLILQQVTIIGVRGDRPVPHRPDGRHRPVGRRHHGSFVGRDGKVRHAARPAAADRLLRPACWSA